MKKLVLMAVMSLFFVSSAFAAFPEKNIQGYIMWGAGGAMDNVARAVAPNAGKALGRTIILQN
ncbi:MAG: tripartite tricarboxylate transporter substrate binding protein, partial [Synergistaceae bacterium]